MSGHQEQRQGGTCWAGKTAWYIATLSASWCGALLYHIHTIHLKVWYDIHYASGLGKVSLKQKPFKRQSRIKSSTPYNQYMKITNSSSTFNPMPPGRRLCPPSSPSINRAVDAEKPGAVMPCRLSFTKGVMAATAWRKAPGKTTGLGHLDYWNAQSFPIYTQFMFMD